MSADFASRSFWRWSAVPGACRARRSAAWRCPDRPSGARAWRRPRLAPPSGGAPSGRSLSSPPTCAPSLRRRARPRHKRFVPSAARPSVRPLIERPLLVPPRPRSRWRCACRQRPARWRSRSLSRWRGLRPGARPRRARRGSGGVHRTGRRSTASGSKAPEASCRCLGVTAAEAESSQGPRRVASAVRGPPLVFRVCVRGRVDVRRTCDRSADPRV